MEDFKILSQIIRNRRAIAPNQFKDEIVEQEILDQILENANWAPTHRYTEPWRFHIFSGSQLGQLAEKMGVCYRSFAGDSYKEMKFHKVISKPPQCSHVIVICMKRDPQESLPVWEERAAVACAVQNLWLSVSTAGLAGYWSSPAFIKNFTDYLDAEAGEECLGFFYLGVPVADPVAVVKRKPIDQKVKWYTD